MIPKKVALEFVHAFCEGRLDDLEHLLHPDLRLDGPLAQFSDAASYMLALRSDPPETGSCEVHYCVGEETTVATLYDYISARGSLRIAQFFVIEDGRVRRTQLAFDPAATGLHQS